MAQITTRLQRLSGLATEALEALEAVIQDKQAPPASRVSAARFARSGVTAEATPPKSEK